MKSLIISVIVCSSFSVFAQTAQDCTSSIKASVENQASVDFPGQKTVVLVPESYNGAVPGDYNIPVVLENDHNKELGSYFVEVIGNCQAIVRDLSYR